MPEVLLVPCAFTCWHIVYMLLCANLFSIGLSLGLWPAKSLSIRIVISRRLFWPAYHLWLVQFDILARLRLNSYIFEKQRLFDPCLRGCGDAMSTMLQCLWLMVGWLAVQLEVSKTTTVPLVYFVFQDDLCANFQTSLRI